MIVLMNLSQQIMQQKGEFVMACKKILRTRRDRRFLDDIQQAFSQLGVEAKL
jgi:hypothetical protein